MPMGGGPWSRGQNPTRTVAAAAAPSSAKCWQPAPVERERTSLPGMHSYHRIIESKSLKSLSTANQSGQLGLETYTHMMMGVSIDVNHVI